MVSAADYLTRATIRFTNHKGAKVKANPLLAVKMSAHISSTATCAF